MSKEVAERMLAFQSDPSLPALLSSTSSVSADLEGEFLGNPGVVGQRAPSAADAEGDTTDSLTPPALGKEPAGFPLDAQYVLDGGVVAVRLDGASAARGPAGAGGVASRRGSRGHHHHLQHQHQLLQRRRAEEEDEGDDDSDSDEGLTMARRKKVPAPASSVVAMPSRERLALPTGGDATMGEKLGRTTVGGRRGTNASVGSTETAKKVFAAVVGPSGDGEVKEGVVVDSE